MRLTLRFALLNQYHRFSYLFYASKFVKPKVVVVDVGAKVVSEAFQPPLAISHRGLEGGILCTQRLHFMRSLLISRLNVIEAEVVVVAVGAIGGGDVFEPVFETSYLCREGGVLYTQRLRFCSLRLIFRLFSIEAEVVVVDAGAKRYL